MRRMPVEVRSPTLEWTPVAVVAISMLSEIWSITPDLRWLAKLAGVGLWIALWRRENHLAVSWHSGQPRVLGCSLR